MERRFRCYQQALGQAQARFSIRPLRVLVERSTDNSQLLILCDDGCFDLFPRIAAILKKQPKFFWFCPPAPHVVDSV